VTNQIHPSALVSSKAELGQSNTIGPFTIIEDGAVLGNNNRIAAHTVIKKSVRMSDDNVLSEHIVLGGIPQYTGFDESTKTYLDIGNGNVFREGVTINCALHEGESTQVGDRNFLMHAMHIGHDCIIGNDITFGPSTGIGGHVEIADKAFISGGVMVHQFGRIGRFAMVGGNAKITQDVLPFMITDGNPATVRGLNLVGLKRAGLNMSDIKMLKQAFQLLFQGGALEDNLDSIQALKHVLTEELCDFIAKSERGFHRSK